MNRNQTSLEEDSSDIDSYPLSTSDKQGKKDSTIPSKFANFLQSYYKLAILFSVLIGLNEELSNPMTLTHQGARFYLDQPNFVEFMIGNAKPMGLIKDQLEECSLNMTFKEFMRNLITDFQPCIFRSLALEWPALTAWENKTYLLNKAGESILIASRKKANDRWGQFSKDFQKQQISLQELIEGFEQPLKRKNDFALFIHDEQVPPTLSEDIQEPNVTAQILNLQDVTFSVGRKPIEPAKYNHQDTLTCVVIGNQDLIIVPAYEYFLTGSGAPGLPLNISPVNFGKHDTIRHQNFEQATKYKVSLSNGDCIYIPAYWWYQVDSSSELAISVTYWYEISSEWLKLVFSGIEKRLI